jgi:hypothetical protein
VIHAVFPRVGSTAPAPVSPTFQRAIERSPERPCEFHAAPSQISITNDGTELQRQRFSFALDDAGISEGQADPLLTWGLVIGLALFVGGAVGLGLGLGGFILPRCENLASRVALIGGGTVAVGLGLLIGLRHFVG